MRGREELQARRRRGRTEPFDVTRQDPSANGLPAQFAVKSRSGRSYTVTLRSAEPPFNHCSCPDFATNRLGTCKHIEAAINHLEQNAPNALEAFRKSGEPAVENLVYVDFSESKPTVKLHLRTRKAETVAFAEKFFGKRGALSPKKTQAALGELTRQGPAHEIVVAPEAAAFMDEALRKNTLDQQCARLAQQLARTGSPEELNLKPYQVEGAAFLVEKQKALLLDDTGLDKPTTAMAAVHALREGKLARKVLVLCHESRIGIWRRMFPESGEGHLRTAEKDQAEPAAEGDVAPDAMVLSYNKVYRHVDALKTYEPSVTILDQAHRIRNWQGRTGQAIKALEAPFVFALGSPVLFTRPVQFFYLTQLLDPYLTGPAWQFFEDHLVRDSRGAVTGHRDMDSALARLQSIILRRTRKDVQPQLPSVIRVPVHLEPTSAQRKLMTPVLRSLILKFETDRPWEPVDRAEVVAHLARLRKLCDFLEPGLSTERSPKVRELMSLFADLKAEGLAPRAVVFTRFRDVGAKMASVFQEAGLEAASVSRDTPADARKEAASELADRRLVVLVVCDEILEEMHPVPAELAVHLDVPWSPVTEQARMRASPGPQPGMAPIVVELIVADSVEDHAYRGLKAGTEELARILPDIAVEMEALPAQGDEPLKGVVEIMLDLERLKAELPEPPRPAGSGSAKARARARTKKRVRPRKKSPKPAAAKPARSRIGPAGRGDVMVLGLATRNARTSPAGQQDLAKLGLAVAVTYSFMNDAFTGWRHDHVNHLIRALTSASMVVGLEPLNFDYRVLSAYTGLNLTKVPTIEILSEVKRSAGQWVPPELLMQATLERRRRLVGDKAVELWRTGRIQELAEGVYEDVRLTRDLFLTALKNGKLHFRAAPSGELRPIYVDIKKMVPEGLTAMLERRMKNLKK